MNITVNVEGPIDLGTVIGEHYVYDEDGDGHRGPKTILDALVNELVRQATKDPDTGWGSVQRRVDAIRTEEIRARVVAELEAALTEPVRKTTEWGEPTSGSTTLRAEIVKIAGKALEIPRPGYSAQYPRETSAVQQFLQREIEETIKRELAEAIADEKAKVVAAVRAKAAELIANAVKQGVGL